MIVDMNHNEAVTDGSARVWTFTEAIARFNQRRYAANPHNWISRKAVITRKAERKEMAAFLDYLETTSTESAEFFAALGIA